jgi:predicted alpha/beta hydrolase family esterase
MEFTIMSRDDPKQRAAFEAFEHSAKELESTAAEVVHAGHALFKDGLGYKRRDPI